MIKKIIKILVQYFESFINNKHTYEKKNIENLPSTGYKAKNSVISMGHPHFTNWHWKIELDTELILILRWLDS